MSNLALLRFDSYQTYQNNRNLVDQLFLTSQDIEKRILRNFDNQSEFEVSGYCSICDKETSFSARKTSEQTLVNWREELFCTCGFNNRTRAAFQFLKKECKPSATSKIYITEQVTPFYQRLKSNFSNLIGSEYLADEIPFGAVRSDGIRNESLTQLSFPNSHFDIVISLDVLEHIADYKKAFSEIYRVLNESGILLFSVPFNFNSSKNIIRAFFGEDGTLKHVKEPEYHGNPLSDQGCLCFQHFGWEVLDELKESGFEQVALLNYWSDYYGYLGAAQVIFIAYKKAASTMLSNNQEDWTNSTAVSKDSSMVKAFPDGHFYSPIVDIEAVKYSEPRIWKNNPGSLGIDFKDIYQQRFLTAILPKYLKDYDYPLDESGKELSFYDRNSQFSWLDSKVLFCLLRHLKPQKMIEIGSGFSSLLVADVNRRFLEGKLDFTCIEPYPRDFLLKNIPGISRLISQKVEDVPLSIFTSLQAGDVLFIDSSHVSKTGSDVNYIYFEVIPCLAAGVYIHVHDIFLPCDYPKEWIIEQGRSWNEQYILQALLMYSSAFEVVFGSAYAFLKYPDLVQQALQGDLYGGGSFWFKKIINSSEAEIYLKQQKEEALSYFNLGHQLTSEGHVVEASACYRKAIELDPELQTQIAL